MEQKRTELHGIDDIRAVFEVRVTKEVNQRGEAISRGNVHHDTEHPAGWECLVCDVKFQRWPAVAAHLQTPRPTVARDSTPVTVVRSISDQAEEIKHFARDLLGFDLFPAQVEMVQAILKDPGRVFIAQPSRTFGRTAANKVAWAILQRYQGPEAFNKLYMGDWPEVKHDAS